MMRHSHTWTVAAALLLTVLTSGGCRKHLSEDARRKLDFQFAGGFPARDSVHAHVALLSKEVVRIANDRAHAALRAEIESAIDDRRMALGILEREYQGIVAVRDSLRGVGAEEDVEAFIARTDARLPGLIVRLQALDASLLPIAAAVDSALGGTATTFTAISDDSQMMRADTSDGPHVQAAPSSEKPQPPKARR